MEFLDLIESYGAGDASARNIYGGEGVRVASRRRNDPRYQESFDEALGLIERVASGSRHAALLFEEAMSTADFPLLFGDVIDRMIVGAYREYPSEIESICKVTTVRDFRTVSRHAIDGAEGDLAAVGEQEEYPEASLAEGEDSFAVGKFGRVIPMSWETLVNDDLDGFRDLPGRLGRATRRSEQRFITGLYIDSSGPHASLYSGGNANVVTGNPALTTDAVETAIQVLLAQTDTDSEPVYPGDGFYLVVPPALTLAADQIVNQTERRIAEGSDLRVVKGHGLKFTITPITDPYIPLVASSSNGSTTWCLFASSPDRPALEFARLRGHEMPEVWVKSPNAMRVGGGDIGPDQGDFDTDSIRYRVRAVFGGARLTSTGGFRSTVGSEGDGS